MIVEDVNLSDNFPWLNPEEGREVVIQSGNNAWRGILTQVTEQSLVLKFQNGSILTFSHADVLCFKCSRTTVRKSLPCIRYM